MDTIAARGAVADAQPADELAAQRDEPVEPGQASGARLDAAAPPPAAAEAEAAARAPSPAASDITPTTQHPLGPWPDVEAFKLAWRDWANVCSPSFRLVVRSSVAFGSGGHGRNVGFCELVCSKPHRTGGKVRPPRVDGAHRHRPVRS